MKLQSQQRDRVSRFDYLDERWPSRLVATAEEDRLSISRDRDL
jgi:hypothetical protein